MITEVANFNNNSGRKGTSRPNLILGHTETNTVTINNVVYSDEDFYTRFQNLNATYNQDFDIDQLFKFNYYLRKGADKPYYSLNYATLADNVTGSPTFNLDTTSMANALLYNGQVLAQDLTSQAIYGKIGAVSGVSLSGGTQADIQTAVNAELLRTNYPSVNIECGIVDSAMCPFSDVNIGDSISVNFPSYFSFNQLMRIIEMSFDDMTGICTVSLGNIIYRPQKPNTKIYLI
jgi:hypothetical protein